MLDDLEKWLRKFGVDFEPAGDNWIRVACPFHTEDTPSGFLSLDSQIFHCKGCGAKGDIYKFLAAKMNTSRQAVAALVGGQQPGLPQDNMIRMHEALLKSKAMLAKLEERKGLNIDTVKKYKLGLQQDRVIIPIFDESGQVVNFRKWSPTSKKYKMTNETARGGRRLYPLESLQADTIIIAEGEMKALLLLQLGFNAVAPTGGAGTWAQEWNNNFRDKIVYILYDIDKSGRGGATRVAGQLHGIAREVHDVLLPMSIKEFPTGDITDWVTRLNHTADDVRDLLSKSTAWKPLEVVHLDTEEDDPIDLSLAQAAKAEYFYRMVRCEVVVAAKDIAPYIVPCEFEIACAKDKDYCAICPVNASGDLKSRVVISHRHPILLELIDTPVDFLRRILKKGARIPRPCEEFLIEVISTVNVVEVRLMPQLAIGLTDDTHIVRRAFYVGHDLEANVTYKIEAKVLPEPKTQYATLLITNAEPATDSLSRFVLEKPERLEVFQPERWTLEGIREKFEHLYNDLAANVTQIYQRQALHEVLDMAYHSVLYVPYQGRVIKGWVEALVLGDSGQGKSETAGQLMKFYGLGEKVDAKGASVAGLVGGLQESGKRWFVSWGVITLQDRRLVVLEEVKGLAPEVISRLTEVRSSGIAEVAKVEKARTNARTRLIWISNPRSDRQLLSYNFGVEAIKELIGALEDIRRFDIAILVTSGEVNQKVINLREDERPKAPHVHTSELCRDLILWGWSRSADQVLFPPDAESMTLDLASELGRRYVSNIPLIEAADQRLKLARLATACAVRTFSNEGDKVLVRPCHVEYVAELLDRLYSQDSFGYDDYSKMVKSENEMRDPEEVKDRCRLLPFARDTIRAFLDTNTLSPFDICDWTNMSLDEARAFVGFLVRKNALKRARRGYVKTVAFIGVLKMLEREELPNATTEVSEV